MTTSIKSSLITLSMMTAVYLLAACDKTSGVNPTTSSVGPQAHGTSDSGGGTGVDGKVFESYIVDPTELAAYKQVLAPSLANLVDEKGEPLHLEALMKMKTWYVAPIELEKIGKATLGVSFMNNDTQQIARQTSNEVWISKPLFDAMNMKAQSELMLHELVMEMYFLKFQRLSELCEPMSAAANQASQCAPDGIMRLVDQSMPPEKTHPLDEQDNANIRAVTGWLLKNAQRKISQTEFFAALKSKNFDQRIFRTPSTAKALKDIEITSAQLLSAIQATDLVGTPIANCAGIATGQSAPCHFQASATKVKLGSVEMGGLHLIVTLKGSAPIEFDVLINEKVSMFLDQDLDNSIVYSTALLNTPPMIHVGDRVYSGFLNFRRNGDSPQAPLMLNSIVIKPSIVTSIDRSRDPICEAAAPQANQLRDDGLVLTRPATKLSLEEEAQIVGAGYVPCMAQNVQ